MGPEQPEREQLRIITCIKPFTERLDMVMPVSDFARLLSIPERVFRGTDMPPLTMFPLSETRITSIHGFKRSEVYYQVFRREPASAVTVSPSQMAAQYHQIQTRMDDDENIDAPASKIAQWFLALHEVVAVQWQDRSGTGFRIQKFDEPEV